MDISAFETKPIKFIRLLCKDYSEEEIKEAEERFRQYLRLIKRVSERLQAEYQAQVLLDDKGIGRDTNNDIE